MVTLYYDSPGYVFDEDLRLLPLPGGTEVRYPRDLWGGAHAYVQASYLLLHQDTGDGTWIWPMAWPRSPHFHPLRDEPAPYPLEFFAPRRSQVPTFLAGVRSRFLGLAYGFFVRLSFRGVGFKVQPLGPAHLALDLGCSHHFLVHLPPGVTFRKVRKYDFLLHGPDRQRLLDCANRLQALRYPDVYKAKGIHHSAEALFTKQRNKDAKRR
jgi:ribosomal protein L6P/L9E